MAGPGNLRSRLGLGECDQVSEVAVVRGVECRQVGAASVSLSLHVHSSAPTQRPSALGVHEKVRDKAGPTPVAVREWVNRDELVLNAYGDFDHYHLVHFTVVHPEGCII